MTPRTSIISASGRRINVGGGVWGSNDPPAFMGPWLAVGSPWRTPIPSTWANFVHADTPSMVQGIYVGTDYSSNDIHAWAYRPTEMQAKWGTAGLTYMKWLGPGGEENVIYSPNGTPTTVFISDFDGITYNIPFPSNWTGYKTTSADERRTSVVCEDGSLWNMYGLKSPSETADGKWHGTIAVKITGGWAASNPLWLSGGSGYPQLPGIIVPQDIAYAQVHGDFGHALALNWQSGADGTFAGHPKNVWSCSPSKNTDGRTKTAVGIPFGSGARVFLDPSMTDAELAAAGVTKDWMLWIAHTFQRYGGMAKESSTGQGGAGGIMCETIESINWNKAHGFYASNFQWPWFADGTMTNDHDNSTYNGALPPALVPTSGSRWKVWDWNKAYTGISTP